MNARDLAREASVERGASADAALAPLATGFFYAIEMAAEGLFAAMIVRSCGQLFAIRETLLMAGLIRSAIHPSRTCTPPSPNC